MSKELIRRAAPALAVTGAALTVVALSDPALRPEATRAAAGPADCAAALRVVGDTVGTRFGPVAVEARVAGSTLCAVAAVQYPDGDPRSAQINARAVAILDDRASSVGTVFDAVSGATYTSEGYRSSLQSIVDRL